MKKQKILKIVWTDSQMYLVQCERDDDFDFATITSYGEEITNDENKVVIAGDVLGDDVRRVISIPKENIKSIKVLK